MSIKSKEGEMSRRKLLGVASKVMGLGGIAMLAGRAVKSISATGELNAINEAMERAYPSASPEELNVAKEKIDTFDQNATQRAKESLKNGASVVTIPIDDPEKLANAFAVFDRATVRAQEERKLINEKDIEGKRNIGALVLIIGGILKMADYIIQSHVSDKNTYSPANNPPDASLPAPTKPSR